MEKEEKITKPTDMKGMIRMLKQDRDQLQKMFEDVELLSLKLLGLEITGCTTGLAIILQKTMIEIYEGRKALNDRIQEIEDHMNKEKE